MIEREVTEAFFISEREETACVSSLSLSNSLTMRLRICAYCLVVRKSGLWLFFRAREEMTT